MNNGLYNGLDNGLHNGVYSGLSGGVSNGLFVNEITFKKKLIKRGLQLSYSTADLFSYTPNTNTIRDLTANNYNGILYNSIPYNPISKGLVFNGTNHYVKTGLPTKTTGFDYYTDNNEYISIGVWIKYTDSQNGAVLSKRNEGGGYENTILGVTGSSLFGSTGTKICTITGAAAGTCRQILTTNSYNDGKWHYMVLVQGLSYDSLYIDGVFIANSNTVTSVYQVANTTLFLGVAGSNLNPLNALFYKGEIGVLHFYKMIKYPMNNNEIANNFEATRIMYGV